MKIKGVAEAGKTILLSCAAAEAIVNPVAKWVFKTPQKDSDAVIKIFQQMKKMKISKIGVLSGNTGFGNAGKGQIEKLAPEYGITIAANEVYDAKASDLTAEVTKIKAANVQALINWSIVPAQAIVIKNARQIGLKIPIFQSHGFGNIKYVQAAGAAAEGVMFPAGRLLVADVLPKSNPQKALLMKYKKDYESPLQGTAEHLRRPRLRRIHDPGQGDRECEVDDGQGGGPDRHRAPQGLRRHRRHLQLLADGPQRPQRRRLRDADREEREVRHLLIGNRRKSRGSRSGVRASRACSRSFHERTRTWNSSFNIWSQGSRTERSTRSSPSGSTSSTTPPGSSTSPRASS